MAHQERHLIRKPRVTVVKSFGAPCAAKYHIGNSFHMDEALPEESFRCTRAFEALEPFLEVMEERGDHSTYPDCQFVASCDCPLAHSEVVFYLYSEPTLSG